MALEQADLEDDLTLPAGRYTVDFPLFLQGTNMTMEPGLDVTFARTRPGPTAWRLVP